MTREQWSSLVRWAAIAAGVGLLLLVLGARAPAGPQRWGVSVSAPGGQSSALAQTVADMAGPHISGPYTNTTKAFSFDGNVSQLLHVKEPAPPNFPEMDTGLTEAISPPSVKDPVVQSSSGGGPGGPNMPSPLTNFVGLAVTNTAGYHPPDTNGDVGLNDYVQNVNASIGIFSKSTGALLAPAFSFSSLFLAAGTGTLCDTNNAGDPVVLYDAQFDRFIVTDFAFTSTTSGPTYECIAASKTSDPVAGGWWFYALLADSNQLADYPKLGVWPDAIYMSANMFNHGTFNGTRVWALNRNNLYSGAALDSVHFDVSPSTVGTLLPSNLRGTAPPGGTPNYFVSNISDGASFWALDVFKFHVDFGVPSSSTFTGPTQVNVDSFTNPPNAHAISPTYIPEVSGNGLDSLGIGLMVQNQYRRIGNSESLWVTHSADNAPTGVRWYQLDVTGGTIATTPVQQSTYKGSPADSNYRWMPSLAVDKSGNMAIGYSVSSASIHPDIRYAGRLVTDTPGTLGQAEVTLASGGGGQTGACGILNPCYRWGDYSAMTVDPTDDCTFWYTNEYYAVDGPDWLTRIGSFKYPSCGAAVTHFSTYLAAVQNIAAPPPTWTTVMQEGFEGTWPSAGWTRSDTNGHQFDWATSTCQANTGIFSAWALGGGSVGSGLGCGSNYPNNADIRMAFGPFSLVGATAAQFKLQIWLNTELHQDKLCYYASSNNNNFGGTCWSGNSGNAFFLETLDLSNVFAVGNMLGQPNVWVVVRFVSDGSVNFSEGGFVDDLLLRKCTAVSCPGLASGQEFTNNGQLHSQPSSLTGASH